jgi:pimeloyl-ACP methyl ester carboxylesterase
MARFWRGIGSAAAVAALPLGGLWRFGLRALGSPERLDRGLALVLPGIDGQGPINWGIARGLADGGWPGAILVHDWTTGLWPLLAYHLRAGRRNRRKAVALAGVIASYQDEHPGQPVYLVGHSGGGALAVWALEALPKNRTIAGAILLGPALSPGYKLGAALTKVEHGIWNFWSPLDVFFLAAGTLALGTIDGPHAIAAGCRGFRLPEGVDAATTEFYRTRLFQVPYRLGMAGRFHLGGHVGCCNRVFVAESVAPLLAEPTAPSRVGVNDWQRNRAASAPGA